MRCSGNLFDGLAPSNPDTNKAGIQEIFQTIFLERIFNNAPTVCAITIETDFHPGASVLFETYRCNELQEKKSAKFASVDAAVVEAGRLAHHKMCDGFHYRLASADTGFRDKAPLAIG
jgi:hypothetical protein